MRAKDGLDPYGGIPLPLLHRTAREILPAVGACVALCARAGSVRESAILSHHAQG